MAITVDPAKRDLSSPDAHPRSDLGKAGARTGSAAGCGELPGLSDDWFGEADHHVGERHVRRGRPKLVAPKKQMTMRLDAEVLDGLRATGPGWQGRVNGGAEELAGRPGGLDIVRLTPGTAFPRPRGRGSERGDPSLSAASLAAQTGARVSFMLRRTIFALLLALSAGQAAASGRLPPEPLPGRTFADFPACLAHLRERAEEDRAAIRVPVVEKPDGSRRRKLASTHGVRVMAPGTAQYEVRIGFEERVPDRKAGFLVTHFSYEETRLLCRGATLTGTLTKGFVLPGYEPMPDTK